MRFTVKAKLASAFGVVLLLSMAAGGVAYVKLTEMIATADSLVARAKRMERAAELEKGILLQVRAEKNLHRSAPESECDRFQAEICQAARRPLEVEVTKSRRSLRPKARSCWTISPPPTAG